MDIRTSPLVQMADEAERPTRWWAAWLVGIVIILTGLVVGGAVGAAALGNPTDRDPLYQFTELFMFGTVIVLLALWLRFKERRPFTSVGLRGTNPVGKLALGLVIGAGMMAIGVAVPWALGQYGLGVSEHGRLGADAVVWLVPLLVVFILQGSTEEIMSRGYMLQVAGLQIPAAAAIAGSSIIFSALHLAFAPIPFINIVLYAVFVCFVALGEGGLWLVCGIHAGWNYFQGNIFGLPVSGHPEATSLWDFGPVKGANDLVTGGNFGVEASLVGTGVLAVALVLAIIYYRRQQTRRAAAAPEGASVA